MSQEYAGILSKLGKHNVGAEIQAGLTQLLTNADDSALYRMNPRKLARILGLSDREALRVVTFCIFEGYLSLIWQVVCPACHAKEEAHSFCTFRHDARCKSCGKNFHPRLDSDIQVTVSPHPSIRAIRHTEQAGPEIAGNSNPVLGIELLLLPEFRHLFPNERTLPGEGIEVRRIAVIFTDLADSTAMYSSRGDLEAFRVVKSHFMALSEVVSSSGGLTVKTIGDAVMAVFRNGSEAFAAALKMRAAIQNLNHQLGLANLLNLKIGIHAGPSLSVSLNGQGDFFGATVNLAARIQGIALPGEIVLSDQIAEEVRGDSQFEPLEFSSISATLKGVPGNVALHRH